ncbi:hypothetical protein OpiT1DRAFT_05127 [Opitutaceae bacterium TAV1]|nr:hypothetical protein OpiT1DRAFT_05127 [Opitutaceae bacterium TAV1]
MLGVVPQHAPHPGHAAHATHSLAEHLGFTDVVHSWAFVFTLAWLLLNLGLTTLARALPFRRANLCFLLNHLGLWIALAAGMLGAGDLRRLTMDLCLGATEWRALDTSSGNAASGAAHAGHLLEMPFALELTRFDMETFPPRLALADPRTGDIVQRHTSETPRQITDLLPTDDRRMTPNYWQTFPAHAAAAGLAWLLCIAAQCHPATRSRRLPVTALALLGGGKMPPLRQGIFYRHSNVHRLKRPPPKPGNSLHRPCRRMHPVVLQILRPAHRSSHVHQAHCISTSRPRLRQVAEQAVELRHACSHIPGNDMPPRLRPRQDRGQGSRQEGRFARRAQYSAPQPAHFLHCGCRLIEIKIVGPDQQQHAIGLQVCQGLLNRGTGRIRICISPPQLFDSESRMTLVPGITHTPGIRDPASHELETPASLQQMPFKHAPVSPRLVRRTLGNGIPQWEYAQRPSVRWLHHPVHDSFAKQNSTMSASRVWARHTRVSAPP